MNKLWCRIFGHAESLQSLAQRHKHCIAGKKTVVGVWTGKVWRRPQCGFVFGPVDPHAHGQALMGEYLILADEAVQSDPGKRGRMQ